MNSQSEDDLPESRAEGVTEDDSDEENEDTQKPQPDPVLRWNKKLLDGEGKLNCQCLIIAVGQVAAAFVDSLFCSDEREILCSVCCGGSSTLLSSWSQTAPQDSSCFVWRRKGRPEVALCQCREKVSSEQSFSWVQQLFSTIKPSTVIILDSQNVSRLKSGSELLTSGDLFPLYALRSSALTSQPCCPFLEPPNTIGGLSAEVLTHCEVKHVPAVLYVAYVSSRDPLTQLIAAFTPILACSIIQPYIQDVSQQLAAEHKKLASFMKDTGSLYL